MTASARFGSRREARETALGVLYESEVRGESIATTVQRQLLDPPEYAMVLLNGIDTHIQELDEILDRFARDWALDRMPVIDRSVLRLAVFELVHRVDVPTAAVLSEAVELASRYSTEDSGRFVNGLLAKAAKDLRGE